MKYLLFAGSLGSGMLAYLTYTVAKSAVHEIEALIFVLIGTVCFGLAAVIDAIDHHQTPTDVTAGR